MINTPPDNLSLPSGDSPSRLPHPGHRIPWDYFPHTVIDELFASDEHFCKPAKWAERIWRHFELHGSTSYTDPSSYNAVIVKLAGLARAIRLWGRFAYDVSFADEDAMTDWVECLPFYRAQLIKDSKNAQVEEELRGKKNRPALLNELKAAGLITDESVEPALEPASPDGVAPQPTDPTPAEALSFLIYHRGSTLLDGILDYYRAHPRPPLDDPESSMLADFRLVWNAPDEIEAQYRHDPFFQENALTPKEMDATSFIANRLVY